jgi:hypothetical protein
MIPPLVLAECRIKAQRSINRGKPTNWVPAGVIVAIWVLLAILGIRLTLAFFEDR